jgi:hypothetical protein
VHAKVPGRGRGPGHAGGQDPAEAKPRRSPRARRRLRAHRSWGGHRQPAIGLGKRAGVDLRPGVTLGRRDLDEAREEQWNGSRRRGSAGLGVAEGGAVLDRLGVAEGVVEVRGEAEAGGQGVEVSVRWAGGGRTGRERRRCSEPVVGF